MLMFSDDIVILFFAVVVETSPTKRLWFPPIRVVFVADTIRFLSDKYVSVFVPATNVDASPVTVSILFSAIVVDEPPRISSFLSPWTLRL